MNLASLYADDILICSCNPGHNLPVILQTMDWFYITSGCFAATVTKPVFLKMNTQLQSLLDQNLIR